MDQLTQQAARLWDRFNLAAVADILIVTFLVYGILSLLQGTRANQVLRGGIILLVGLLLVSTVFHLPVLGWFVNNSLPALVLVAAVIFAPELRRALEQIGHTGDIFQRPLTTHSRDSVLIMVQEVCDACVYLSNQRWGGLMVIERNTGLQDLINSGQIINGRVSSALLSTIFMVNSELHDGAVIIRGDRIVAAHVTLPLADDFGSRHHLGHRHKAAVGITEQTDAIAVIVSEETGSISVANNGELLRRLTKGKLRDILISLLLPTLLNERQKQTQSRVRKVTRRIASSFHRDNDWRKTFGKPRDERAKTTVIKDSEEGTPELRRTFKPVTEVTPEHIGNGNNGVNRKPLTEKEKTDPENQKTNLTGSKRRED